MNWLDIVIIIFLVISIFGGLKNGLIASLLSLAGVIVGIVLAGQFYIPLSERLTFISRPDIAQIVAFAIILIAIMVVAAIIAKVLKWVVSLTMLGWIDKLGGAAFGLLLGAIFAGAALTVWVKFFGFNDTINQSALATILLERFPVVLALLPGEFDSIRSFFK